MNPTRTLRATSDHEGALCRGNDMIAKNVTTIKSDMGTFLL